VTGSLDLDLMTRMWMRRAATACGIPQAVAAMQPGETVLDRRHAGLEVNMAASVRKLLTAGVWPPYQNFPFAGNCRISYVTLKCPSSALIGD
jgi:hypothetical protein